MRKKSLTVDQREIQIINWFSIRIQHDNEDMASLAEIAEGLGMSPSSHLRKIVDGLVERGTLTKELLERPGRWIGWGYKLKEGTFKRPQKQTIRLNFHKEQTKQLELLSW